MRLLRFIVLKCVSSKPNSSESLSMAPAASANARDTSAAPPRSAGIVVVRRADGDHPAERDARRQPGEAAIDDPWRCLLLRAYRDWDFPKGMIDRGETPLEAAIRETAEEASIASLAFDWGHAHCDTAPY